MGLGRGLWRGNNRDRTAVVAEAGQQRRASRDRDLGGAVAFVKTRGWHHTAVESQSSRARRDQWFLPEHHAQFSRLGGNPRVHRRTEIHNQRGRIRFIDLRREVHSHVPDEQPSGGFMKCNWGS